MESLEQFLVDINKRVICDRAGMDAQRYIDIQIVTFYSVAVDDLIQTMMSLKSLEALRPHGGCPRKKVRIVGCMERLKFNIYDI